MGKFRNFAITGAFLAVLGAMLWTVQNYGTSLPFYDEWEAEAGWLYRLYEQDSLGFSDLFHPHNGHRPVLTRLTALLLYIVNAGWDPQLQMIINALLHALICAVLVRLILLKAHGANLTLPIVSTVVLFAIPFSWLSILVAFQTQFYFMVLFSILSLNYLSSSRYLPGYLFAIMAMLAMTPGAFVLPAFVGMMTINTVRSRAITNEQIVHSLISAAFFIAFIMTLPDEPEPTASAYYAQHIRGFLVTVLAAISWPFRVSHGIGLIVYMPLAIYLFRAVFVARVPLFLLSLAIFMALQILAMAFFRGGEGVPPANRYWEIMIVGLWLNGMCAAYLANHVNIKFARQAALLWLFIMTIGMSAIAYQSFTGGLPARKAESLTARDLVEEYLETGNQALFDGRTPFEVSHPDTGVLINLLDDAAVRTVLPSSLGVENQDRLQLTKSWLLTAAPLFFAGGLILLAFSIRQEDKDTPPHKHSL